MFKEHIYQSNFLVKGLFKVTDYMLIMDDAVNFNRIDWVLGF